MMNYRRLKQLSISLFAGTLLLGGALFSGCSSDEPATVYYGDDACAHCTMLISDKRFAAQLKTAKGKAYKFDAIECMAAFSNNRSGQLEGAHYWVKDFSKPEQWIPAKQALFLQSPNIQSPMGLSLLATQTQQSANELRQKFGGETMSWSEIQELVKQTWNE